MAHEKTTPLYARIPVELKKQLDIKAINMGISLRELTTRILKEGVRNDGKQ